MEIVNNDNTNRTSDDKNCSRATEYDVDSNLNLNDQLT